MSKPTERFDDLKRALERLEETVSFPDELPYKESTVQRFEFTFELAWKVMQDLVRDAGMDYRGPKGVIRAAAQLSLVDDPETWFEYLQDRNEMTHMYKMVVLERVFGRVPGFIELVKKFVGEVEEYLERDL